MPRDQKNQKFTFKQWTDSHYRNGSVITNLVDNNTQLVFAERDTPVSTQKGTDGEYHLPTSYYACSSRLNFKDYDFSLIYTGTNPYQPVRVRYYGYGFQLGSNWRAGGDSKGIPTCSTACVSAVRSDIRSKIRDSDVQLGVMVGEMRETIATIRSIVDDVRRLTGRLSKGALRRSSAPKHRGGPLSSRLPSGLQTTVQAADKIGGQAASQYLRYIYGVRPFMNDIWGILNYAMTELAQASDIVVVSAKRRDNQFSSSDLLWSYFDSWEGECFRECSSKVAFSIANPYSFELWRLGLTNPFSIAWELVTLSFVIDWFTGLGNAIDALQKPLGLRFHWGYETHYLRKSGSFRYSIAKPSSTWRLEGDNYASAVIDHRAFRRNLLNNFTGPKPYLDLGLNTSQVVNGTALIVARLSKL